MDHEARAAEINWLRGKIAEGSRDVHRIHLPLIGLLIEAGETAEAIALSVVTADLCWADGSILKAFAVLNRALTLIPDHPKLMSRHAAWRAQASPALLSVIERRPTQPGTAFPLQLLLEEYHRGRITRCTIRVADDPASLRVAIEHADALPEAFLRDARYAVAISEREEPIQSSGRVTIAQVYRHELELVPADDATEATFREAVRSDPTTGLSNITALMLDTGMLPPLRVRNVYCASALADEEGLSEAADA